MSPSQHVWQWAFAMADPTVWNSLPDNLRDPDVNYGQLKRLLKAFCFQHTSAINALDVLRRYTV